jgi:hypothetical protein
MLPRREAKSRADLIWWRPGCVRPGVRRAGRSTAEPDVSGAAGAALIERSTGEMLLGPPKSRAGRRVVGIPEAIIPALSEHLALFVGAEPGSLVFPWAKGGPALNTGEWAGHQAQPKLAKRDAT